MIFYLRDLNNFEEQIADNVLCELHIKHKRIKNHILVEPDDIDFSFDDEDMEFDEIYIISYDIKINTSLELFDYAKWLIDKRAKTVVELNKRFYKKEKAKKKVGKNKNATDIHK